MRRNEWLLVLGVVVLAGYLVGKEILPQAFFKVVLGVAGAYVAGRLVQARRKL